MHRLYHVSEKSDIARFDPQPALNNPSVGGDVVWAVDEEHLSNYLLPRDCPRVCWLAESGNRIIAIEWDWFDRVRTGKLFLYEFEESGFALSDKVAGYYVCRASVTPQAVTGVEDILRELKERNVELRIMDSLWSLHDEIASSRLEFSMIRMRNAHPRS